MMRPPPDYARLLAMQENSDDSFYQSLPVLTRFEGVADASNYMPLPEGWVLAVADIVGSTQAIAEGRYKAVNMAGASIISALLNAFGAHDLPFIFGGDGAMVAVPGRYADRAAEVLASIRLWIREEMKLAMRVALVPMADIRSAGFEVGIARFAASELVSYAMFNGGGASWAEQQMKAGLYDVAEDGVGPPDLTGLSCRWNPIAAHNGEIFSIIAKPTSSSTMVQFQELVAAIVAVTAEQSRDGHPMPEEGPGFAFSRESIQAEVVTVPRRERAAKLLSIITQLGLTIVLHAFNVTIGRFNARRYTRDVAANSDFRKFDDGLKMTVDVDQSHRLRIEALLLDAEAKGVCRYGLHRQDSALVTCFVPTPLSRHHIHFIDGASGGYALAASRLAAKHPAAVASP